MENIRDSSLIQSDTGRIVSRAMDSISPSLKAIFQYDGSQPVIDHRKATTAIIDLMRTYAEDNSKKPAKGLLSEKIIKEHALKNALGKHKGKEIIKAIRSAIDEAIKDEPNGLGKQAATGQTR